MGPRFTDRRQAGEVLAAHLTGYADHPALVVLGLPRGGVPVAAVIARSLGADLDVLVVRKLGAPGQPELALGAIAAEVGVVDAALAARVGVGRAELEEIITRERAELERRERSYRGARGAPRLDGATVIVVDDGLATGASMLAAARVLREAGPAQLVAAVPVGAPETCARVAVAVDDLVCPLRPSSFRAVGCWYEDFGQVSDEQVHHLLATMPGATEPPRPP